jgi:hypothetical protein
MSQRRRTPPIYGRNLPQTEEEQTMTTGREELKKKTLAAVSAEEVMEILKAAGE